MSMTNENPAPIKLHPSSSAAAADGFDVLVRSLDELLGSLRRLDELASTKLTAMRSADAKLLEQCAMDEGEVLRTVLAQGPNRGALLAAVAQRMLGAVGPPPTLQTLSNALPEPQASILRAKSRVLEGVTAELQRKNRLAGEVARRLHSHIRGIFADVAKASEPPVGYGPRGSGAPAGASCYVEAIG